MQNHCKQQPISIYIAAPFSAIAHAQSVAYRLQTRGYSIASTWLNTLEKWPHIRPQIIEWMEQDSPPAYCDGEGCDKKPPHEEMEYHSACEHGFCLEQSGEHATANAARNNIDDVLACDVMLFLPDDGQGAGQHTPGKFVEMGIALAFDKPIVRVKGPTRSIFDAANRVYEEPDIAEAFTKLDEITGHTPTEDQF